jgi:cobyrinic acid a,c-diamide synthase
MKIPRLVIGGTNSGCGKTTVSIGIMAALVKKGVRVQPFKVGPDYIDPAFHTFVTGRYSRNLDSWMLGEKTVLGLFERSASCADISVMEVVMGFYDGLGGGSTEGSTAHIAAITRTPVILILNAESMGLSAAAIVRGFVEFDRNVEIAGVILNNIYGEGHYKLLKEAIESNTNAKVLGYLERTDTAFFESRHLGLVTAGEIPDLRQKIDVLAQKVSEGIDLELLAKIAQNAPDVPGVSLNTGFEKQKASVKISVAMDKAFNFYYRDGLELLEKMGAQLEFFSPLEDKAIPSGTDGLYIGGGYPEVFAQQLEKNISMKKSILETALKGMPVYAECGGLMYLSERLRDIEGREYAMTGVIPCKSQMTRQLQRFGYTNIKALEDNILCTKGQNIRAHEFHCSKTTVSQPIKECFSISRAYGDETESWKCGYKTHNVLAGYPHIHFWSNPEFAKGFVESCIRFEESRRNK